MWQANFLFFVVLFRESVCDSNTSFDLSLDNSARDFSGSGCQNVTEINRIIEGAVANALAKVLEDHDNIIRGLQSDVDLLGHTLRRQQASCGNASLQYQTYSKISEVGLVEIGFDLPKCSMAGTFSSIAGCVLLIVLCSSVAQLHLKSDQNKRAECTKTTAKSSIYLPRGLAFFEKIATSGSLRGLQNRSIANSVWVIAAVFVAAPFIQYSSSNWCSTRSSGTAQTLLSNIPAAHRSLAMLMLSPVYVILLGMCLTTQPIRTSTGLALFSIRCSCAMIVGIAVTTFIVAVVPQVALVNILWMCGGAIGLFVSCGFSLWSWLQYIRHHGMNLLDFFT
jgi:hypothetical protein